jgi:hypothetical protein
VRDGPADARKALAIAVKNDKVAERHSALDLWLAGVTAEAGRRGLFNDG